MPPQNKSVLTNELLERIKSTAKFVEKARRSPEINEDDGLVDKVTDYEHQLADWLQEYGGTMAEELLKLRGVGNGKV